MRILLSWLKEFVDITISAEQLAQRLTVAGAEVTRIEYVGVAAPPDAPSAPGEGGLPGSGLAWDREKIVVGQIVEVLPHPNADRLVLADVDYDTPNLHRIVTGAPNLFGLKGRGRLSDGPKVAFAMEGAALYDGHLDGWKLMTLKGARIRGVYSNAMACSEKELGLSEDHEGVIILDPDAPVGTPLADYLGDIVLEIEILPNIARYQSIIGAAREVAALTGARFQGTEDGLPSPVVRPVTDWVRIEIEDTDLCPRYSAALIRDVAIGPSPYWMQHRLRLAGLRPINNIVDITNYVMLEWGQPLHAFDYDQLVKRAAEGTAQLPPVPRIIVRRAAEGERITTLDGVARMLTADMLLITDTAGPIAVAGVMGGAETEIGERTRNVLLESANFHYINNRRTAARLKLPSEATARFGRGVPPAHTVPAALRAADLMRQFAGAQVASDLADAYPGQSPPATIGFNTGEIKRLLGIEVPVERVVSILQSLHFTVQATGDRRLGSEEVHSTVLEVVVPEHRLDVSIPADLVEEVGRVIGYDQIPPTLMQDELPPQRRNAALEGEERLRDLLAGMGLQEIISYSLTTAAREALLYPDPSQADVDPASYVRIANPISAEREVMRQTLMASLLDTLREALRHRERMLLFEIGRIYRPRAGEILPAEHRRLGIALAGPRAERSWLAAEADQAAERLNFFDIKGVVDVLARRLNLPDVRYLPGEHPAFHPARAATFSAGGTVVGTFGEIHPLVREHFDLPGGPVCLAEFDLEELMRQWSAPSFRPLPRFPVIREDIAVVVGEQVPAAQVEALIREAGGSIMRSVTLFDLYRGEQIGAGKKSLAYALAYQHDERTLTDDEAARVRGHIVKKLRDTLGAELRA